MKIKLKNNKTFKSLKYIVYIKCNFLNKKIFKNI